MPELPEVETVVRGLRTRVIGARLGAVRYCSTRIDAANAPGWTTRLRGLVIQSVSRRGKYIIIHCARNSALVIHLRMTGRLWIKPAGHRIGPYDRFVIGLSGRRRLILVDPRQFARVNWCPARSLETHSGLARLGPDALTISFDQLAAACRESRRPIKSLLLDQTRLAGLGNIYVDETLHAARIHPRSPAHAIGRKPMARLHRAIREILTNAIVACGTTFDTFSDPEGNSGGFAPYLRVYRCTGRPCRTCGRPIRRIVLAGRGTHFCPRCQRIRSAQKRT